MSWQYQITFKCLINHISFHCPFVSKPRKFKVKPKFDGKNEIKDSKTLKCTKNKFFNLRYCSLVIVRLPLNTFLLASACSVHKLNTTILLHRTKNSLIINSISFEILITHQAKPQSKTLYFWSNSCFIRFQIEICLWNLFKCKFSFPKFVKLYPWMKF